MAIKGIKRIILEEVNDFDWVGDVEISPIYLLKDRIEREFPNIEMEMTSHGINAEEPMIRVLVMKNIYDDHTRHEGMAFIYNEETKFGHTYSAGDWDDTWDVGGTLVESDLSFWAWGNEDHMIEILRETNSNEDGSPYVWEE